MANKQVRNLLSQRIETRLLDLNIGQLLVSKATTFNLDAALCDNNKSAALWQRVMIRLASNTAAIKLKSTGLVMNRLR
jgi:Na+-transporting NADH:ubiquinone oxidoreductase subunit NqrC